MKLILIIACVWVILGIIGFLILPEEKKNDANLFSFIVFILISPIVTIWALMVLFVNVLKLMFK